MTVSKKQKIIWTGVTAVIAVVCLIGLIWWAESSWSAARELRDASSASSVSSLSSSLSTDSGQQSSSTEESSSASGQASSTDTQVSSSSTVSASTESNNQDNGVATDTASAAVTTNSQDGKIDAQLMMTWWDAGSQGISANGGAYNVIEKNGTCTLIATQGATTRKASRTAIADATTTTCGEITIPRSELGTGNWNIQLLYSSDKASGRSGVETVQIDN